MCDIEDYMRSLQPGRLTVTEYFLDNIKDKNIINEHEYEEPDSFIGAKAILEFSTHIRKYSGGKKETCDNYKTSKQVVEEKCDGHEITAMLKDLNVFGSKNDTPSKKPRKTKKPVIKKGGDDLMPLLLDESYFKLTDRNTDSNTDSSRDGSYSKKEYTPREVYYIKRKK